MRSPEARVQSPESGRRAVGTNREETRHTPSSTVDTVATTAYHEMPI